MAADEPADFHLTAEMSERDAAGFHWVISDAHGRLVDVSTETFATTSEALDGGRVALERLEKTLKSRRS